MSEERPPPNARSNRLGVDRRREDREKAGPDAPDLVIAGFKHEGGGLWSRDGAYFGREAALQKAWAERAPRREGGGISVKDAS